MRRLRLYDYAASGNCVKARIMLAHLGLEYERVPIDILGGDTLTDEYGAVNPARQTPVLEIDGDPLPQSNAILWYLAEGTPYLPDRPRERAEVVRWLHFEQEWMGSISALRFRLQIGAFGPDDPAAESRRSEARGALALLDGHLAARRFLVGDAYTIADIATYGYAHVAPEATVSLDAFPAVRAWIERVESQPGFVNDLVPVPATARLGLGLSIYG
jgi:glutathione S-transferase